MSLRRVGYRDAETGQHYFFLTNAFELSAQSIADIYKERWQVELFFKWIKQNLKIKTFLGTSKKAVMTQIWIALITLLMIAYYKFKAKIGLSLSQILKLVRLNLFVRKNLLELIDPLIESSEKTLSFCCVSGRLFPLLGSAKRGLDNLLRSGS
jgi:IS4 transposase